MRKFREFWIVPEERCDSDGALIGCDVCTSLEQVPVEFKNDAIRVIEYSAFERLDKQNKILREALKEISGDKPMSLLNGFKYHKYARAEKALSDAEGVE